jgi:hypothetical protein
MRNLTSLLSSRTSPTSRASAERPAAKDDKRTADPKPVRKRCLNEAAHKLGR